MNVDTVDQVQLLSRIGRGTALDLAYSPAGDLLAVATGVGVYLYDPATLEIIDFLDVDDAVTDIAFEPSGKQLALAHSNQVEIWNVQTGEREVTLQEQIGGWVNALEFGRNGYVAVFGQAGLGYGEAIQDLILWKLPNVQPIYGEQGIWPESHALDFDPQGTRLVYFGERGMGILDLESLHFSAELSDHYDAVFSPDGEHVFTSSLYLDEPRKSMIELSSSTMVPFLEENKTCGLFRRGGELIICLDDHEATLFDSADGSLVMVFSFEYRLREAVLSPDDQTLAVIDSAGVRLFDVSNQQEKTLIEFDHFNCLTVGQLQWEGKTLPVTASCQSDGRIQIVELDTGTIFQEFSLVQADILGLAIRPDQTTLLVLTGQTVDLWDIANGEILYQWPLDGYEVKGPLTHSPDGQMIAMNDQGAYFLFEFDLQNWDLGPASLDYLKTGSWGVFGYSPESHLITPGYHKDDPANLYLTDHVTNTAVVLPYLSETDYDFVEEMAISKAMQVLAVGAAGGQVTVFDLTNQSQIIQYSAHEMHGGDGWIGSFCKLEFSPASNLLYTAGNDDTGRFWNAQTGELLLEVTDGCNGSFTPDGRYFVTVYLGVIRVWGIP